MDLQYILLILLPLSTRSGADSSQWLMTFNASNCDNANGHLELRFNNGDADVTSRYTLNGFVNSISFKIFGLWKVWECLSLEDSYCLPTRITPYNSQGGCFNYTKQNWTSHLRCTQYGDAMQQAKSINFYKESYLDGARTKIVDDTPTLPVTPVSLYFAWNHSWTIYTEPNYNGEATCLIPEEEARSNGYGFTTRSGLTRGVRSVREGCHESSWTSTTEGYTNKCSSSLVICVSFATFLVAASILFSSYLGE